MTRLRLSMMWLPVLVLGATACGDDGDGGTGRADGGVDGGIPEVCPFRPLVDECRILETDPESGGCPVGEGCYWLSPPCETNEDCREGTICELSDRFDPPQLTCQEDLDMDGTREPAAQGFCQVVSTSGAVGDACTRFDDCADGLTCRDGACAAYCCARADCGATEFCLLNIEQRGTALGGRIGTCTECQACTLAPNGGCDTDDGCYLLEACAVCLPAGGVALGEACEAANDCVPGAACVRPNPTASFRCQQLCVEGTADCDAGQTCQTGLVPSDPTLGTCVPSS